MDVGISAVGAISAAGANAAQTCASIRAGICRFTEHAYFECAGLDPEWDPELPLFAASVPLVDPFLDGNDRLLALAVPALTELMRNAKIRRADLAKAAFFLALPHEDTVTRAWRLGERFAETLCRRTGLAGFKLVRTNQQGHTGVMSLVADAVTLLQQGEITFCIVGGIDSYLSEDRLEMLDASWRIRSERNVDGYIPGEAAAMVMLETASNMKKRGIATLATIDKIAFGVEPNTISSDKASTGKGLCAAIARIFPEGAERRPGHVYCDLNGESYRAFEWGVVLTRLAAEIGAMKKIVHPADCVGDIGAATGAMLLTCAADAFKKGYAVSMDPLLWTSSDNGARVAMTLKGTMGLER